jgi:hypothetical protein
VHVGVARDGLQALQRHETHAGVGIAQRVHERPPHLGRAGMVLEDLDGLDAHAGLGASVAAVEQVLQDLLVVGRTRRPGRARPVEDDPVLARGLVTVWMPDTANPAGAGVLDEARGARR